MHLISHRCSHQQEVNSQRKIITSSQLNCHLHNQYTVLCPKSYLAVKHSMVDTKHKMLTIAMDTSSDKYTSREFRQLYLTKGKDNTRVISHLYWPFRKGTHGFPQQPFLSNWFTIKCIKHWFHPLGWHQWWTAMTLKTMLSASSSNSLTLDYYNVIIHVKFLSQVNFSWQDVHVDFLHVFISTITSFYILNLLSVSHDWYMISTECANNQTL